MKKIINITALLFLGVYIIYAQESSNAREQVVSTKKVFWLHGNNSSSGFWSYYAQGFSKNYPNNTIPGVIKRDINIYSPHVYGTTGMSVKNFADEIKKLYNTVYDIGVAHSMGGSALRYMDVNPGTGYPSFKGIITAGTPLYGMRSVETTLYTSYEGWNWATNAIYKATLPITAGVPFINMVPRSVWHFLSSIGAYELLTKGGFGTVQSAQTVADLRYANGLDVQRSGGISTSTPKIHIWGDEYYPAGIRGFLTEEYTDYISIIRDAYFVTAAGLAAGQVYYQSGLCLSAADYLNTKMNIELHEINGAIRWEWFSWSYWKSTFKEQCSIFQEQRWVQKCPNWIRWLCYFVSYVANVIRCVWTIIWEIITVLEPKPVLLPTDGLVRDDSQRGENQYGQRQYWSMNTYSRHVQDIRAEGVGHNEMGNHEVMTRIFDDIFKGNRGGVFELKK